jgi:ATP-dependent helicase/nuclease subunit B
VTQAFVQITPTLAEYCATHTILTPNERLAREYRLAFDLFQLQQHKTAWPTLSCMSLSRHLRNALQHCQNYDDNPVLEISDVQLMQTALTHAPVAKMELVRTFMEAWQTIARYDINIDDTDLDNPQGQLFRSWFKQVQTALPKGCLLPEKTGDYLVSREYQTPRPLLLIDFDRFTVSEQRYLAFANEGVGVGRYNSIRDQISAWSEFVDAGTTKHVPAVSLTRHGSLTDEVAAAARWARMLKFDNPTHTIGIVVPELAQNYQMVQRQCAAIFDPARGSESLAFDLAAGTTLRDQPLWRHAEKLLDVVAAGINAEACLWLANSPFLQLDELATLSSSWPKHIPALAPVTDLAKYAALPALMAACDTPPKKGTLDGWINYFQSILDSVGWPNLSDLQSVQYQAFQALEQVMIRHKTNAGDQPLTLMQALAILNASLQQAVFAPQRPHSDVLILGVLETTGLQFDHLWVCGLDENSFPARNKANPFVPRRMAVRYRVPRSSQADELQLAKQFLHQWQSSSGELQISYTHTKDDNKQLPSPLLTSLKLNESETQDTAPNHPYLLKQTVTPETFVDTHGTSLPEEIKAMTGGTGLLFDQAQCPFRAYAVHRLGLGRPLEVSDFPNALVRGNLLHETLFHIVRQHSNQELLSQLTTEDVEFFCAETLRKHPLKLPQDFVAQEIIRLTQLVMSWLTIEHQREPFETIHLEESFQLTLGQLSFRIRIDRIDRINNHWVVIDYKTGRVSLAGATRIPTVDPQLPAYSLIDEKVAGVYYAEVRPEPRLLGVADDGAQLQGGKLTNTAYAWSEQRLQWRLELERLSQSFVEGDARVAPLPGACAYCHLQNICRIDELRHES